MERTMGQVSWSVYFGAFMLCDTAVSAKKHDRLKLSGMCTQRVHDDCWSETVRTGTQLRYALYEDLGSEVRAFRLCANASEH